MHGRQQGPALFFAKNPTKANLIVIQTVPMVGNEQSFKPQKAWQGKPALQGPTPSGGNANLIRPQDKWAANITGAGSRPVTPPPKPKSKC